MLAALAVASAIFSATFLRSAQPSGFNALNTRLTQAILQINSEDQVTEQLSIALFDGCAFRIDGKALT